MKKTFSYVVYYPNQTGPTYNFKETKSFKKALQIAKQMLKAEKVNSYVDIQQEVIERRKSSSRMYTETVFSVMKNSKNITIPRF